MNPNTKHIKISPVLIPRDTHNVSRANFSQNTLKVLYRLQNAGYQSFLVGGAVRDLLLDIKPKDFDVVTNAHPEQIRKLFQNCYLIGRRFRLAHVRFGREIIEVSTFRANHIGHDDRGQMQGGQIIRDNVYGTIDDDVWRRDFTINALFYNIRDFSIIDYVGAMQDIQQRVLRLIGEPQLRYQEDPVRLLRAIRFAAKLDFSLSAATKKGIPDLAHLLETIPKARIFEEMQKLFLTGHAKNSFQLLCEYGLFKYLFLQTHRSLYSKEGVFQKRLIELALSDTDARFVEQKTLTPAFLVSVFLWVPIQQLAEGYQLDGMTQPMAFNLAADTIISQQVKQMSLAKRITCSLREIWSLQYRLMQLSKKRALKVLAQYHFRAAYDLLDLRVQAGEQLLDELNFWKKFRNEHPELIKKTRYHHRSRRS